MKSALHSVFLLLFLAGTVLAQITLPADGLVGHWTFDDAGNLARATVGNDLVPDKITGALNFKAVAGPAAGNGAVNIGIGSFYRCYHDIEANGFDPTLPDSLPSRVNRFALVVDFRMPARDVWYALHATDNNGDPAESDWDFFIRTDGALGLQATGYSFYKIQDTKSFFRLVITANLGNFYNYYLDGQLLREGGSRRLDDRFSLDSPDGSNQVLFFGDNDGEDSPMDIAELALYDRPLTAAEIAAMGGYGHFIEAELPVAVWNFDKADSLFWAKTGESLELVGNVKAVAGPSSSNGAAAVGGGAFLRATPNILPNGFNAPQGVNRYTLSMDIRQPQRGKFSAIMQTNPDNTDDADLFVNPDGRIGSATIGWSDSTLYVGEWSRVVMTCNAGDTLRNLVVYVDAKPCLKIDKLESDGDLALAAKTGLNKLLFFADENGEDAPLEVANLVLYNRPLTEKEVIALGKYEHLRSKEVTPAQHTVQFRIADEIQYAKIPYHADFDFGSTTSFTIECWIRPDLPYDGDPAILSNKDWDSGGNPGWVLSARGTDWKFNIADQNNVRFDASITTPNINDGFWHHLAVIVDREKQEFVLITDNSVTVPQTLVSTDGTALGDVNTGLPVCIMQDGTENYAWGYKMPGAVDEVRIWNAALTPETVKRWAHRLVSSDHPDFAHLITYLKFDEASGKVAADASGKGHDAELKGAIEWQVSYAPIADPTAAAASELAGIWGGQKNGASGGLTLTAEFKFALARMAAATATNGPADQAGIESYINEQYALSGHNSQSGVVKTELPAGVVARYGRVWYLDASATYTQKTRAIFTLNEAPGAAANYVLLNRSATSGNFAAVSAAASVEGNNIIFANLTMKDKNYYTLGTRDETASPLGALSAVDDLNGVVFSYALQQAYPNPFNPATTIAYSLAKSSEVRLTVFNSLGQAVALLVNNTRQPAGLYRVTWDARNMPSGMYFYRLEAGSFCRTQKMLLIK
jgi:hypothetical protein